MRGLDQWRATSKTVSTVKDTLIEVELDPYPVSFTMNFYRIQYIGRSNPYNYFVSSTGTNIVYLYCGSTGHSSAGAITELSIGT